MNYRHIFHAGNICDVVKHILLVLCLDHLRSKEKAFCVLDTHGGCGLYDLNDQRSLKTQEAQKGIYKLLLANPLPQLSSYYKILQVLNPSYSLNDPTSIRSFHAYPGSPMVSHHKLRPQDRLIACELHPEDSTILRHTLRNSTQAHIHCRDGYEALQAFLPPQEKRGLVLIDPPYEKTDEFDKLPALLSKAYKRFPQGLFLVWYPIKDRPALWRFHEALIATGIPKQLCAEFIFNDEIDQTRLNGSGCILINPPWTFTDDLPILFKDLHRAFETTYTGININWLVT